jgi:phage tail-like protein
VTNGPFTPEPPLYLRRAEAEIPFYDPYAACDPKPEAAGTWELLLQQARGRYLKLRLAIAGDGRGSPKLKALRVYYPRFSYPRHYLPAAYLDDPVSGSFVERLLANPKGFYSDIEAKIAHVGYLFDPRSAPTDALDWLAGWLGLTLDPLWQDVNQRLQPAGNGSAAAAADRRRLFIRFATRLFTRRGTADGIRFGLHLLLEPCLEGLLRRMQLAALIPDAALSEELERLGLSTPGPTASASGIEDLFTQYLLAPMRPSKVRIVERFMTRAGLAVVAGDPTQSDGSDDSYAATAHRFAVLVPETLSSDIRTMVSRIVDLEKPAHTDYEVRRYWDYFRVGEARLGFDTILGQDARFMPMVLGQSALLDGYLAYPPPANAPDRVVLDRDRLGAMPAL